MRGCAFIVDGSTHSLAIDSQDMTHYLSALFATCAFTGVVPSRDMFVFPPFLMMTRVITAIRGRKHEWHDCRANITNGAVVVGGNGGCEWCNAGASAGMSQVALSRESQRHGSRRLVSISSPQMSLAAPHRHRQRHPALATLRCPLQDNSWNFHPSSDSREYQTSH
jgi:hypothetical protein